MKNTFWNHINIRTEPPGANVLIFYDRGPRPVSYVSGGYTHIRRRGVTPIQLRPTAMAGLGEKSYFSLVIYKRGFKSIVKDFKVSGNAEYVFHLEPVDDAPRRGAEAIPCELGTGGTARGIASSLRSSQ